MVPSIELEDSMKNMENAIKLKLAEKEEDLFKFQGDV